MRKEEQADPGVVNGSAATDAEQLLRLRAEAYLHARNSGVADPCRDPQEVVRLGLQIEALGHPRYGDAYAIRYFDDQDIDPGIAAGLYAVTLERRLSLCSSTVAPSFALGYGWRLVLGSPSDFRAELVLPKRVAIVDGTRLLADARANAWRSLVSIASDAVYVGLDPVALLGVSMETCEREHAKAAGISGKRAA